LAVWNANKAESKGAEFDLNSSLLFPGLSIAVSGSYADAKFTEDYFIPADIYGDISGRAGQQLPGSPKVSAAATINYQRSLLPGYDLIVSLNDTYRGAMYLSTFPLIGQTSPLRISGMDIANVSASITHQSWRLGAYVTNVADKRTVQSPPAELNQVGNLTNDYVINPARQIGL